MPLERSGADGGESSVFGRPRDVLLVANTATSAHELVARLEALGIAGVDLLAARQILEARRQRPGKVFRGADDIPLRVVPRPIGKGKKQLTDRPALLFPVRLETRFRKKKDAEDKYELLVRIYPDSISIDVHQRLLTEAELESAQDFKANYLGVEAEEPKRAAWRELCKLHGVRRSSFIAQVALAPGELAGPIRAPGLFDPPRVVGMPSRYFLYAYRGAEVLKARSAPVARDLRTLPPVAGPDLSRWMTDFDEAKLKGMAIVLDNLSVEDVEKGFDRVVVVGLNDSDAGVAGERFEELLGSHRHTGGVAFLQRDTATNNSETAPSGHSASTDDDADAAYDLELFGAARFDTDSAAHAHDARRLGAALGIGPKSPSLRFLSGADRVVDSYSEHLQRALWPATGDHFFRYLLEGALGESELVALGEHFARWVRADGPLPALRIGTQPYGILPACTFRERGSLRWQPSEFDVSKPFYEGLRSILGELLKVWGELAENSQRVPRVDADDDPDQELLQILSMEPQSTSYRERPFIDERLAAWLVTAMGGKAFGVGTLFSPPNRDDSKRWIAKWLKTWFNEQQEAAQGWSDVTGMSAGDLRGMPALRMLGWLGDRAWSGELVAEEPSEPDSYLRALAASRGAESNTLLFELLDRALKLAGRLPVGADGVRDSIRYLAASPALEFFNAVTSADAIVRAVTDDPEFGSKGPRAYGIRPEVARTILKQRDAINQRPFGSLQELERQVHGVGRDTMHDIVTAFSAHRPSLEPLLRGCLDLCTHRLDAWMTSLATKRLHEMRQRTPQGLHLGAYGCVEDVRRRKKGSESDGYVHTMSRSQTAAAALLRSAYKTHKRDDAENPFCLDLSSERVRRALRVLDGVRSGQPLGALLGYEFERGLQDRDVHLMQYVDDLRKAYPLVAGKRVEVGQAPGEEEAAATEGAIEAQAARNVVDGLQLARAWLADKANVWGKLNGVRVGHKPKLTEELKHLADTFDAIGDVLLYEAVFHTVGGNYERAGAALEAAAGNGAPPEVESMRSPLTGRKFEQRVCVALPAASLTLEKVEAMGPRALAEPRLAEWFARLLGSRNKIACGYKVTAANGGEAQGAMTVEDLSVQAIDLLYLSTAVPGGGATEIEQLVACCVRDRHAGLGADSTVEIKLDRQDDHTFGLGEALELGRRVLALFAEPPMQPRDVCGPGTEGATFTKDDVEELLGRVNAGLAAAGGAANALAAAQGGESGDMMRALRGASQCGVGDAVPSSSLEATLAARLERAKGELDRRIAAATGHVAKAAEGVDYPARINAATEACRALFGRVFVILPSFVPLNAGALEAGTDQQLLPDEAKLTTGSKTERVRLWLQQCAKVYPSIRSLEDVLLLGEGWSGAPVLEPAVFQLSTIAPAPWVALADAELPEVGQPLNHEQGAFSPLLSLVVAAPKVPAGGAEDAGDADADAVARWAGLTLQRWEETIPEDTVGTSVGFHYDAPSSQAPNCLLLAVPSQFEAEPTAWTPQHLAAIVSDTMDLAKARAVDLDAMRFLGEGDDLGLGVMLPGLLFPSDREDPRWSRRISTNEFERAVRDWANNQPDAFPG